MRLKLSVRKLIPCAVFASAILVLAVRFGHHIHWKVSQARHGYDGRVIPTQLLTDERPLERLVTCRIGPIAFEIPAKMASQNEIHRGIGGVCVNFYDNQTSRQVVVEIPTTRLESVTIGDTGKTSFSNLSFPRFYKLVIEEQNSDFSWFMTHSQLSDHKFLLEYKASIPSSSLVEYIWKKDFEAVLTHSKTTTFQWTSLDDNFSGAVHFNQESGDVAWVRHCCATFKVDGRPVHADSMENSEINSMIKIVEAGGQNKPSETKTHTVKTESKSPE